MYEKPIVVNDEKTITEVRAKTLDFLNAHPDLHSHLSKIMWAYHEIGTLIPQTLDNIASGHYFPYSESYNELENSYQLCLGGFYRYSFIALRSVLELGFLGVYFAVDDKEAQDVQGWLNSIESTPRFRAMLAKLMQIEYYKRFNEKFTFSDRVTTTYGSLSDFVHTRGYNFSSSGQSRLNVNQFSELSLKRYCDSVQSVIVLIITAMLIKYPIGMQALPLWAKFGLNGPAGGFLEGYEVDLITSLLVEEERDFLQYLSDQDSTFIGIVNGIEALPDITEEEVSKQAEDFRKDTPTIKTGVQNGI